MRSISWAVKGEGGWMAFLFAVLVSLVPALANPAYAQVSDKEVADYGARLAAAFNERDMKTVTVLIDFRALAMRAGKDVVPNTAALKDFAEGVSKAAPQRLITRMFEALESAKGDVRMMRVVRRGGDVRAILRFDYGDNGLEYAEYIMEKQGSALKAVDWYQLTTGELISSTLGVISRMLVDPNPGVLKALFGIVDTDQALAARFKRIGELQQQKKFGDALSVIDELPAQIASSRVLMMLAVKIAIESQDDDTYRKRLNLLAQKHGHDPATSFLLIDHYFYVGDIDKAIQVLGVIEARVGRDGATEMLKANMYFAKHDYNKGLGSANEAVRLEPDRAASYFRVATGYTGLGRFADAVKTYKTLEAKFGYQFERADFRAEPINVKFMASPEFKAWLSK